jgi:hypothetical protein
MLLGPESGMCEYPRARLFGTSGVPLRVYPGLKISGCCFPPSFLLILSCRLTYVQVSSPGLSPHPALLRPDVIHLVDPICLGVQALIALRILFPATPIVTGHHTNLPTDAEIFR